MKLARHLMAVSALSIVIAVGDMLREHRQFIGFRFRVHGCLSALLGIDASVDAVSVRQDRFGQSIVTIVLRIEASRSI